MSYVSYSYQARRRSPWDNISTTGPGLLLGVGAFGASEFNASLIWADCQKGSAGDNAAGKRCGQAVQMALNELGYGPLVVDGQVGGGTQAAIKNFSIDNGFGSQNWPTQAMVIKMGQLLSAGDKPGPSTSVIHHVVDGQVIPGAAPAAPGSSSLAVAAAKMGTGTMVAIGAIGAIAIVAIAVMAKKKKSGGPQPITTSMAKV